MVRKVKLFLICVALLCATGTVAHAEEFTAYNGNPSNTYITYFRDILAGIGFNDNYVAFRSGQNEYVMIVGDLNYSSGYFSCNDFVTVYELSSTDNYNGYYQYSVREIDTLNFNAGDKIIYSDLGNYPQLMERGAKYEMLSAVLVCIALLSVVIGRVFFKR